MNPDHTTRTREQMVADARWLGRALADERLDDAKAAELAAARDALNAEIAALDAAAPRATIATTLCIAPSFDWQGRCTDYPMGVYCSATLHLLGQSERGATRQPDGSIRIRFAGVDMVATACPAPSRWWTLAAIDAAH